MSVPLPLNVGFGTITGRFGISSLTAGDADGFPDFQPFTGLKITFTASIPYIINVGTVGDPPRTIVFEPIICTIDPITGSILDATGAEGVNLIATDNPAIAPTGWTYKVEYSGSALASKLNSHSIDVPMNSNRYLTNIASLPSSLGLTLTQAELAESRAIIWAGEAAASAAAAAASAIEAVHYFYEDPVESGLYAIPVGSNIIPAPGLPGLYLMGE